MKKFAGLLVLLVVIGVVTFVALRGGERGPGVPFAAAPGKRVALKGLVGGEKINLMKDPDIIRILRDRYGLEVEVDRRGSVEMVQEQQPADRDFLWPGSQVALEIYRSSKRPMVKAELLLNSPIVLFTWAPITDALRKQGVVQKIDNAYYIVDFPKMIRLINEGRQWKDIGMPQLYGQVVIYSTDPTASSSGNMFAGLLANVLNNGQVVSEATLPKVLPKVKTFFDNQGYMEPSSGTIFQQFLNKGMGDKPIIVGYEAQMLEYTPEGSSLSQSRKREVRTLYPRPTVWTSHPLIALTENGSQLITAMQDKDIQRLAWERHGFRSAVGAPNDVKALTVPGIPENIENVIPMPAPRVMDRILRGLKTP